MRAQLHNNVMKKQGSGFECYMQRTQLPFQKIKWSFWYWQFAKRRE